MAGQILYTYIPGVGRVPAIGCTATPFTLGNVAIVDAVYGNDSAAKVGGVTPFRSVNAAVAAVSSGQSIWILPGTYQITSPIVLPNGVGMRGISLDTVILQANVTTSATMLTMGENCRVEDLALNLTCTGSAAGVVLKGILFAGTSAQTSKVRVCTITVDNSSMSSALTSTVTAVEFAGTGAATPISFTWNALKGTTLVVNSNGAGNKRGVLVSGTNQATVRDTGIYVAQPTNTASTGSYVGAETNEAGGTAVLQLRTSSIGTTAPTAGQAYTASDILQTTSSIQLGPGVDLVSKSAGGLPFTTLVYPTTIYYGLRGNLSSGPNSGYLWPGSQTVSAGVFPDTSLPAAYYRAQQPILLNGLSATLNAAPGGANTVTVQVTYTPAGANVVEAAVYTGSIAGTTLTVSALTSGAIAIGQSVSTTASNGVTLNTYIVSGSGSTWTIFPSQTVSSVGMVNGAPKTSFTGSISGTTLTTSVAVPGLGTGQYIAGGGTFGGTYITAQLSPTTWTVSSAQTVGSTTLTSVGQILTPFTVTFGPTDVQRSFYGASTRLNTGDRIHVYLTFTSGGNAAHDLTVQLDLI